MTKLPALRTALCVCLALGPRAAEAAQPAELPAVRLIATGGTISSRPAGRLTAGELAALAASIGRYARVETEQFSNVPSSDLTTADWLALARRIDRLFDQRPALAGVVVSCGTDTLEEVAYFLHLTVRHDRPVVVAGSMRPPGAAGYDGAANLVDAFRVAAAPASAARGTLVVLGGAIHSAREAAKMHARRLDAFGSREYGLLGAVDADRVVYHRRVERRHTSRSEFDVSTVTALPRVDVLLAYQDAPGDLVLASAARGAAGLVVAGTGAGSMSRPQRDAVGSVLDRGVAVVVTSRTGGGRVARQDQADGAAADPPPAARPVMGEDLSPVKARILLMLALTRTRDRREIQRMFEEY